MKKYILLLIVSFVAIQLFAQEETEKVPNEPVSSAFASGYLIDNQTTFIPDARTLEFIIQHKFGNFENGISDLFGMYAAGSNIRLGLTYVAAKKLQLGMGVTKKNMYTDFNAKWTILEQTTNNRVPVALALFGTMAIDGRNIDQFGTGQVVDIRQAGAYKADISGTDRLSYFSQVIIGRKFTDWLSVQAAASWSHYNMVEWDEDHDVIGLHFNGRAKISEQSSLIFNYDIPLKIENYSEQTNWDTHSNPNLALGIEIATFTHAFQIYIGTADGIIPQDNMMYNQNDWQTKSFGDAFRSFAIGFNITRLWMF